MNMVKLGPAFLCSLVAFAIGCSVEPNPRQSSQREPTGERTADDPPAASPVTPDEILDPRETSGPSLDPTDYVATEGPYRLFGIEPGQDRPAAIIADVRTWSTRAYHEGDAIGRGMRVAKIEAASVTLHGARSDVVLEPGSNVSLRVVRHRLDVVARPLGRHRYALDTAAARAAWESGRQLPSYEPVELYGGPMLKLGPVPPGSLLAAADFQEGDLIASVDGVAVSATTLDELARGLTDGRPSTTVRVYRGGVPLERSFTTTSR